MDFRTSLAPLGSHELLMHETNDCSVKALAFTCNVSYDTAHAALRACGRVSRKGASMFQMREAALRLGYKVESVNPYTLRSWGVKTMRSAAGRLPGNCLVFVKRHVAASIDGDIKDWSEGRLHRVNYVWRVLPANGATLADPLYPATPAPVPAPVPTVKPQPQRKPRTGVTAHVRSVLDRVWYEEEYPSPVTTPERFKRMIKRAKAELTALGVNSNTINTQTHYWKKAKGF